MQAREGEEAGEDVEGGLGEGSMPFVPTPEVMMLMLKGYAGACCLLPLLYTLCLGHFRPSLQEDRRPLTTPA